MRESIANIVTNDMFTPMLKSSHLILKPVFGISLDLEKHTKRWATIVSPELMPKSHRLLKFVGFTIPTRNSRPSRETKMSEGKTPLSTNFESVQKRRAYRVNILIMSGAARITTVKKAFRNNK